MVDFWVLAPGGMVVRLELTQKSSYGGVVLPEIDIDIENAASQAWNWTRNTLKGNPLPTSYRFYKDPYLG
jgi:hypothetical protein